LEDTVQAISQFFPEERSAILESFFLMLCFDAWIGVQDRHFQNWGIVRDIYGKNKPYFSPIYDSARGLFWNFQESKIFEWTKSKQIDQQIQNQIKNSVPQMGLAERPKISHFDLAEVVLSDHFLPFKSIARETFTDQGLVRVKKMIHTEFSGLLSENRMALILRCLELRHQTFSELLL